MRNYGATASVAPLNSLGGVHGGDTVMDAMPPPKRATPTAQRRARGPPWSPAPQVLAIGLLVLATIISLKLHGGLQASSPLPLHDLEKKAISKEEVIRLAKAKLVKLTKQLANTMIRSIPRLEPRIMTLLYLGGFGTTHVFI